MLWNALLLQQHEILSATVRNTEGEGEGTVEGTSGARKDECTRLTVSLELELEKFSEENLSLAVAAKNYTVRMKKVEKMVDDQNLNGMALQQERKRSK